MIRLLHNGDLGDIIASLPILRALGGGHILISEDKTGKPGMHPRESMRGARFDAIKPLLEAQSYVHGVEWVDEPKDFTHDLTGFRTMGTGNGENLTQWQARYLGADMNLEPWLNVPEGAPVTGRAGIVIARSHRYHNYFFPWDDLIWHYRKEDVVFTGFPHEWEAFERASRRKVGFLPTKDLLEQAQLIAGAKLFIGNQSCPFWIAAGLGVPLIQESWEHDLNSVVPRDNAIYTLTPQATRTLMIKLKQKVTT